MLFEIQLKGDNYYECVEISRINVEEYIEGSFYDIEIQDMPYNKTEEQIIFQLKIMRFSQDLGRIAELNIVLYDIKTRTILQIIFPFKINPYGFFHSYMTYFLDHVDFEGGIIVAVAYNVNEVRVFARNGGAKFTLFNCFSFEFRDYFSIFYYRPYFITGNRKNNILFFVYDSWNVRVYDLFDISDSTCLPVSGYTFEVFSNETGEEFYICFPKKIYVYAYICKPVFKSLTLQSASVVAKIYAKSELIEMNLPKQLYRYL